MTADTVSARVVVAGLGNAFRRDDGVGPVVAARAAEAARALQPAEPACDVGPFSDPLDLLGAWDGAELSIVVDAVRSGGAPGTVSVVELQPVDVLAAGAGRVTGATGATGATSTHGIGLAGVWRIARAIGQAPARVVVVGIEGADFSNGDGLSPPVEAAVPHAVDHVLELIGEVRPCA